MADKIRLDVYLMENGYVETRSKAQGIIMSGEVYVDNQKVDKAGYLVSGDENIEVRTKSLEFVSRGGLKLKKAVDVFGVDLKDKTCMDIGASTGGFTDCMLKNGASNVYAVDVGYGQLAWVLRQDNRVVNMERTNIRYVTKEQIGEDIDFVSVDVSFISLKLVLPVTFDLLGENGEGVCLIKPQFEAGRDKVGKKGVVRDETVHKEVLENTVSFTNKSGFGILGLDYSPVKGPEGNIEYLMHIKKGIENKEINIDKVIADSHMLNV